MSQYRHRGNAHFVSVAGEEVFVDSDLEEAFLFYLERTGFHDRWIKPSKGGQFARHRYTPDVELSVEEDQMTHRAIVEVKPSVSFMNSYIARRMRKVAKYYLTQKVLLFTSDTQQWYSMDLRSGSFVESVAPTPGRIPIHKLHKPLSLAGDGVYSHSYNRSFIPVVIGKVATWAQDLIMVPVKVPRTRRRRK